jgi:hypothetical protein
MSSPFDGMFEDIFRLVGQQGPDAWWQTAQQLAMNVATAEGGDVNVDPLLRQRLDEVSDLVGRRLDELVGGGAAGPLTAVTRAQLVTETLAEWHPLIAAEALTSELPSELAGNELVARLLTTMGPLFLGFQVGSAIGHFTADATSCAELPLPRIAEGRAHLHLTAVARLASELHVAVDSVIIFAVARELLSRWLLADTGLSLSVTAMLADATRDALAVQGDLMSRLTDSLQGGDMSALSNPEELLAGLDAGEPTAAMHRVSDVAEILYAVCVEGALHVTESFVGQVTALREYFRSPVSLTRSSIGGAAAIFGLSMTIGDSGWTFAEVVRDLGSDAFVALRRVDGAPLTSECGDVAAWWQRVSTSPFA